MFSRRKGESNTDKLDLLDAKLSDWQILNCRQAFRFVSFRFAARIAVCLLFIFGYMKAGGEIFT